VFSVQYPSRGLAGTPRQPLPCSYRFVGLIGGEPADMTVRAPVMLTFLPLPPEGGEGRVRGLSPSLRPCGPAPLTPALSPHAGRGSRLRPAANHSFTRSIASNDRLSKQAANLASWHHECPGYSSTERRARRALANPERRRTSPARGLRAFPVPSGQAFGLDAVAGTFMMPRCEVCGLLGEACRCRERARGRNDLAAGRSLLPLPACGERAG